MAELLTVKDISRCIGCYSCMLACARTVWRNFSPAMASLQIRTSGGFQSPFIALTCRGCSDAPCAGACEYGALVARDGGGVRFNRDKCVGCRKCTEACIIDVLRFDEKSAMPLPCIQCGTCVRFCPHGVLAMEERE